jgi:hypothetical protein
LLLQIDLEQTDFQRSPNLDWKSRQSFALGQTGFLLAPTRSFDLAV